MKTKLLKLALFAVASVLPLGASAVTETYNFVQAEADKQLAPTYGADSGDGQLLATSTEEFGNRFVVGPKSRNDGTTNGFIFRTSKDSKYKGLYSKWDNRKFTILNLVKGNRVTITISQSAETLKFVDSDVVVVSGNTYTVAADGNLNFVTTGEVYIENVVIEDPVPSVPVTVGVAGYSNTYDFTSETNNTGLISVASDLGDNIPYLLNTADKTFGNKFAVGPSSRTVTNAGEFVFKNWNTEKGFKIGYNNRNFSILDLKAGETLTITFTGGGLKVTGTSILSGLSANDSPVSGTQYTVTADGRVDLTTTANNTYIQNVTISTEQNIGGATLVSESALDFTDVTEIEAYVATAASAGTVTFNRVYKVAAETPLYLKANAVVSVDVPVLDGNPEIISTNLLNGYADTPTSLKSTDGTKYYVFGVLGGVAGFYPVSTENTLTSAAGKAYLELTAAQASLEARSIRMVFDEVTGINTVKENEGNETGDNIWYTLQGARVAKPTHGIYIRNGKKIFIK